MRRGDAENAAPGVHERVFELCASGPPGAVLDAPCGRGALSRQLAAAGFQVQALDIDETLFCPGEERVVCIKHDLNDALPYASSSFDHVVCVEGIEHIENPFRLVREFARVLKPGGKLVVTTPNITNIPSRIKFLLCGSYRYFNSRISVPDRSLAGHIHPVWFPMLEYALEAAGFSIQMVTTNSDAGDTVLVKAAAAFLGRVEALVNKAHNQLLCSPALYFGDIAVLVAVKKI